MIYNLQYQTVDGSTVDIQVNPASRTHRNIKRTSTGNRMRRRKRRRKRRKMGRNQIIIFKIERGAPRAPR